MIGEIKKEKNEMRWDEFDDWEGNIMSLIESILTVTIVSFEATLCFT